MPKGPAPQWSRAADHTLRAEPYIAAAYKIGYETELIWNGISSKDKAQSNRKGLFNAARRHSPQVSVSATIESAAGGEWLIRFKLHDKRVARAHILEKHGPDRTQWPYNPRAKGA